MDTHTAKTRSHRISRDEELPHPLISSDSEALSRDLPHRSTQRRYASALRRATQPYSRGNQCSPKIEEEGQIKVEPFSEPLATGPKAISLFTSSLPSITTPPMGSDSVRDEKKDFKKAFFKIDATATSKYLTDAQALPFASPPCHIRVSRITLTKRFGFPGMGFLWESKDGNYRFLTPEYDVNPEMPRTPGAPGLLLSCRQELSDGKTWTLFVKVQGEKKVKLNYAGEYICKLVGNLTAAEFASQTFVAKIAWGKKIAKHKRYPTYCKLRARMTLRKRLGQEPTEDQISAEAAAIRKKDYKSELTSVDVIQAFERGEEHIGIVKVECISYSHQRAHMFAAAQKAFEGTRATSVIRHATRKRQRNRRDPSPQDEVDRDSEDIVEEMPPPSKNVYASLPSTLRSERKRTKSYKLRMQEEMNSN